MEQTDVAITSPVSRTISVAELERARNFYRDVLGFDVGEEAVYGPARIQFEQEAAAVSAILFFETNSLDRMHSAIQLRGGSPSQIEKANWIKMRMFEVRDPDGHVLWYAQSYDEPDRAKPPAMFHKALPAFPVHHVAAAVEYYKSVLGFKVNYQQSDLGVMDRDKVTITLFPNDGRGMASAYFYVEDADALYAELQSKQARIQGAPVSYPWGLRDFAVLDLDGNQLRFGQTFE